MHFDHQTINGHDLRVARGGNPDHPTVVVTNAGYIMSFVSPKEEVRQKAAEVIGKDNFFVVHLDAPREVCDTRNDSQKESDIEEARAGFEDPVNPDLVLDTVNETADACIGNVIKFLEEQGLLS